MKHITLILTIALVLLSELQASHIIKIKHNKGDKLQSEAAFIHKKLKPVFNQNIKNDNLQEKNDFKNYYSADDLTQEDISYLINNDLTEFIQPNYIYKIEQADDLPDDPKLNEQWALNAVNAFSAWKKATGKNVIVGVIDTGIDYEHPEFEGQLWANSAEDLNGNGRLDPWSSEQKISGLYGDLNGIDDDNNGYIDDVIGYDVVDQSSANFGDYSGFDNNPYDENSHGTLVSGVIAAKTNNNEGIAGLAYDAKIMAVRAFDATGNAESDDIANAILYAVENGAQIINMSFGETFESYLIRDVLRYAYSQGVVLFASSGNNNWNLPHYPSDQPEVISVGGINPARSKYGFGNYGSMLDISAPGQEIVSTEPAKSYKTTNGTSLASPYVAATAALILELKPDLSPAQVKSILQESALDVGDNGWDATYGAGIVNASAALDAYTGGKIFIDKPANEQYINVDENNEFEIWGTTASPLFQSYEILIGAGIMPDEWLISTEPDSSVVLNGMLGSFDISDFKDSIYTIALKVNLKNNKSLETRRYINLYSDQNKIAFEQSKVRLAYENSHRAVLVSASTNKKSNFKIRYRIQDTQEYYEAYEIDRTTSKHQIIINRPELQGNYLEIELIAFDNSGDTVSRIENIFYPEDNFPTDNFTRKNYDIRRSYVFEEAGSIYSEENNSIIMNDISNVGFGTTYSYLYENEQFTTKDSTQEPWLTVGYGDTNGDGIIEFFGTGNQNVILTQATQKYGNPFANILFENGLGEKFWGAHLYDLDNNGDDELIGYNDSSYFVYDYSGGEYQIIAMLNPGTFDITRGSAIGDFDGDGNTEIYFTTNLGEAYIYEYSPAQRSFTQEFYTDEIISDFNQYISAGDFTGDGKLEIMQLTVGNKFIFDKSTAESNTVWQARFLRSTSTNEYEFFHDEVFANVRAGFIPSLGVSYRNGVSAGDVNNDGKDEFIISAFPNLYILTYDDGVKPLWIYKNTLSNSAIVHDFDNNGIKEVGFSTYGRMNFYEYSKNLPLNAATSLDGYATSETSAYLFWSAIEGASNYAIFSIEKDTNSQYVAVRMGLSSVEEINLDDLEPSREYLFVVAAYNPLENEPLSEFSDIKTIYTFSSATADTAYFANDNSIITIEFTGLLSSEALNPSDFKIYDDEGNFITEPASAQPSQRDKVILAVSPEIFTDGSYILKISSFPDYYGNPIAETELALNYKKINKITEVYMEELTVLSPSLIKVKFSEALTKESAENIDNYVLQPIGEIILASRDDFDSSAVLMNFSYRLRQNGARGRNYTLTAQNIVASSGNKITEGAGNTLGFVISQDDLETAYVYPNPIKYGENPDIYFAGLTQEAKVRVLSLDGYEHITLFENDGNGGVEWDGRNKFGERLEPGVYLFQVSGTNSAGEEIRKELHKFVILP